MGDDNSPMGRLLDSLTWVKINYRDLERPAVDIGLPYVTHSAKLKLAGNVFRCYQLSTGVRVLDSDDVARFFNG